MISRKLLFMTIAFFFSVGTLMVFCPNVLAGDVVFSEIFYDTPGDENMEEWIELYNNTTVVVDIGGWTIVDNNGAGLSFTMPAGEVMLPGSFYTLARNSTGFAALYGYDADLYGDLPFLNNSGDALVLYDYYGSEADSVAWEGGASAGVPSGWGSTTSPWATAGRTIVRTDPAVDTGSYLDWTTAQNNGNPQTQPGNARTVLFSEIFYDTPGNENMEEWIELYNNTTVVVDIGGWTIVDNNGTGFTFTIPAGETMLPGSFYTLARNSSGFAALYGYEADLYGDLPFLNNGGDALVLYDYYGSEADAVAWEGGASAGIPSGWGSTTSPSATAGRTIVRIYPAVDTGSYLDWTDAGSNGNPQTQSEHTGSVLFSEIFYDTPGDDAMEEWIELYNNSMLTVDIGGWTIIDNNGAGFTFTIPAGETMLPGSFYTLARNSSGFAALYGYEADLYGDLPFLNNGGDALVLYDYYGSEADAVAWEGGASAGVPSGWGSTTSPWAQTGRTIVRTDPAVDTGSYLDWTDAGSNGNPQTQEMSGPDITPPVPDVLMLPDVLGECSAEITIFPTATDDRAGQVVGTTTDPLLYTVQGTYIVTWTYDDGSGNITTQTQTVIVEDTTAPVPDLENLPILQGECLIEITTIPTATDNCSGVVAGSTADPLVYTAQGTYTVTWTYDDGNGNTTIQIQTVVVEDVTPPVIESLGANPDVLWPPNHKMVPVQVSVTASDNCDPEPVCEIVSISVNEPERGFRARRTFPDWKIIGPLDVNLRAERSGRRGGRAYIITVECTDGAGNSADGDVSVIVPHDKRKKTATAY